MSLRGILHWLIYVLHINCISFLCVWEKVVGNRGLLFKVQSAKFKVQYYNLLAELKTSRIKNMQ